MKRQRKPLTDREIRGLGPGFHSDGQCLYLNVEKSGSKNWIFRTARGGRQRDWGLGGYPGTTLKDARLLRKKVHEALVLGHSVTAAIRPQSSPSFLTVAEECFNNHNTSKNFSPITQREWEKLIYERAKKLHGRDVSTISKDDILAIIKPLWTQTPETGRKALGRLRMILDHAKSTGAFQGENPAIWRGNLESQLPKPKRKLSFIDSGHKALSYSEVPSLMERLSRVDAPSARALTLTVLTASRTSMVTKARWLEVDIENRVWTIPANRMKNGLQHKIPLSEQALVILEIQRSSKNEEFVFANRMGEPLSSNAMHQLLRNRLKVTKDVCTVHGFRTSFRVWASEIAQCSFEAAEWSLAHAVGDRTVRSYNRTTRFDERRGIMQDWADYILPPS